MQTQFSFKTSSPASADAANGITEYKHYLSAGAPNVPGSTQTASLRYLHHDHLGSVAAITDGTTGQVIERLAHLL